MRILKWFLYFAALLAFIWFIFLQEWTTSLMNDSPETEEVVLEEEIPEYEEVSDDTSWLSDSDTFITDSSFEEIAFEEVETPAVEEAPADDITQTSSSINTSKRYLVIIGSFGSEKNAKKLEQRVNSKGITTALLEVKGLIRVVVGSSDNRSEADRLKQQSDANGESAYVLKNY